MKLPKSVAALVFLLAAPFVTAQEVPGDTVDSGLVERAERRLIQIDVTVRGTEEVLSTLTAADFTLAVGREDIAEFVVDRVCIDDGVGTPHLATTEAAASAPRLRTLLFFDQTHLTTPGRRRALELARGLIPELLRNGRSETMIVSAGRRLAVAAEWSSDPAVLLAALERLASDVSQRSNWADQENERVDRMMAAIDRATEFSGEIMRAAALVPGLTDPQFGTREYQLRENFEAEMTHARTFAKALARDLVREDTSRTEAGLNLFAVALRHLDDYPPPKAVVYFADTMRANPGDFYIDLVEASDRYNGLSRPGGQRLAGPVVLSTGNYVRSFQDVIDLSTEKGVRLYTVQGRGLAERVAARTRLGAARVATADPAASTARFKDAESALSGLARETGGRSFLGAADATQIASRILDDLSCLFVLSFHAIELEEDHSTPVWIDVDRPGVELRYRPHLIALSDKTRSRARLARAFWSADRDRTHARILAIPTGFKKGKYTLLVQFAIPGSDHSGSDWDMGVTAIVGQSRTIEASGRVAINQPGLPLVFEAEMRFRPGDYTVIAAAKNRDRDEIVSTRLEGSLPDPQKEDPFVVATVLLQRVPGAFVRGKAAKTSGSLAHGPEHWLRPDRATGILALVCGNKQSGTVTAERRLEGASTVSLDPVDMNFDQERCGLLVDTIDAGTFTAGRFSYAVDLTRGDKTREASVSEFLVVTPEEIAAARLGAGD